MAATAYTNVNSFIGANDKIISMSSSSWVAERRSSSSGPERLSVTRPTDADIDDRSKVIGDRGLRDVVDVGRRRRGRRCRGDKERSAKQWIRRQGGTVTDPVSYVFLVLLPSLGAIVIVSAWTGRNLQVRYKTFA